MCRKSASLTSSPQAQQIKDYDWFKCFFGFTKLLPKHRLSTRGLQNTNSHRDACELIFWEYSLIRFCASGDMWRPVLNLIASPLTRHPMLDELHSYWRVNHFSFLHFSFTFITEWLTHSSESLWIDARKRLEICLKRNFLLLLLFLR
jgi:hypothetical protein